MDEMETMTKALVRTWLGREATEAEARAMAGQARRAAEWVAAPEGAEGELFGIEPAHFDALLRREAGR